MRENKIVYGYGFEVEEDTDSLFKFIKNHKKTFCMTKKENKLYDDFMKLFMIQGSPALRVFSDYPCENSKFTSFWAVVSNIMSRETGIRFTYQCGDDDCGSPQSILFLKDYPWNYNEVEKNVTDGDLFKICKKYMDELGLDTDYMGNELVPKCFGIEYYD